MSLKKGFLRLTVVLSTLLPCIAIIHILAMPKLYSFAFEQWWIIFSIMLLSPVGFLILWAMGLTVKYIIQGFLIKDALIAEKGATLDTRQLNRFITITLIISCVVFTYLSMLCNPAV